MVTCSQKSPVFQQEIWQPYSLFVHHVSTSVAFAAVCRAAAPQLSIDISCQYGNNNNNNDRLTAFDPGQPG